jgi:hypothetical protein
MIDLRSAGHPNIVTNVEGGPVLSLGIFGGGPGASLTTGQVVQMAVDRLDVGAAAAVEISRPPILAPVTITLAALNVREKPDEVAAVAAAADDPESVMVKGDNVMGFCFGLKGFGVSHLDDLLVN